MRGRAAEVVSPVTAGPVPHRSLHHRDGGSDIVAVKDISAGAGPSRPRFVMVRNLRQAKRDAHPRAGFVALLASRIDGSDALEPDARAQPRQAGQVSWVGLARPRQRDPNSIPRARNDAIRSRRTSS